MALHTIIDQYEYDGMVLNSSYWPRENFDRVASFNLAQDDVVLASYPKTGSTWMREMLYHIHTGAEDDSEQSKLNMFLRVPVMEVIYKPGEPSGVEILEKRTPPRVMKTHLPSSYFEHHLEAGRGKFVVMMRNVKDTLVSYYHFYRGFVGMLNFRDGTWEQFFDLFKAKRLVLGDWLDVYLSWWKHRHNTENLLILKYEDVKKNHKGELIKVANFLGKQLSEDQLDRIVQHTSLDHMKKNPSVNYSHNADYDGSVSPFIRKGGVGGWREFFTPEQNEYVQKYYIEEAEKRGLTFEYILE